MLEQSARSRPYFNIDSVCCPPMRSMEASLCVGLAQLLTCQIWRGEVARPMSSARERLERICGPAQQCADHIYYDDWSLVRWMQTRTSDFQDFQACLVFRSMCSSGAVSRPRHQLCSNTGLNMSRIRRTRLRRQVNTSFQRALGPCTTRNERSEWSHARQLRCCGCSYVLACRTPAYRARRKLAQ